VRRTLPWLILLLAACARPDDPRWLLEHGNQQQKLEFIRYRDPPVATPAQVALFLHDDDPWVVANACNYLGQARARDYLPELVALSASPESDVANLAGMAIAQMIGPGDTALLPALYRNLERKELLVRMSAIEAIGKLGDPASVDVLLQRLPAEEPAGRASIYVALGNIGEPRALPALRQALVEIEAMDHGIPNRGHSRGEPWHPDLLEAMVREAIRSMDGKGK